MIDPGNPQRIYIATRGISNNANKPWSGVVYRSDDGGATWKRKLYNLGGSGYQDYVYSLTIHPKSPNILLAATHEHGIFMSSNDGDSWIGVNDGITNLSTRAVVAGTNTSQHDTLYTGIWEKLGVYKSTDLGGSWSLTSSGLDGAHIYSMDIDPRRPDWVYAATYNLGLMRTTDGAESWSNVGLSRDSIAIVRINPADNHNLFAGTAGNGLFASRDSGSTWQRSQAGLNASSVTGFAVAAGDPSIYFASVYGSGVMRSSDHGASWQDFSQDLGSLLVNGLVEVAPRKLLFALTDAGLYRCDLQNSADCWQRVGLEPAFRGAGGRSSAACRTAFFQLGYFFRCLTAVLSQASGRTASSSRQWTRDSRRWSLPPPTWTWHTSGQTHLACTNLMTAGRIGLPPGSQAKRCGRWQWTRRTRSGCTPPPIRAEKCG